MKKTLYILSALLLGLVSCTKTVFDEPKPQKAEETGLVAVTMKVQIPQVQLYATKALGDRSDQPSIKDIRVAVFGTSGYPQTYTLAEPINADGTPAADYATENGVTYYFKVLLPVYDGEAHVHIIANGDESIKFVDEDEESIMTNMRTQDNVGAFWARIVMPDGILAQLDPREELHLSFEYDDSQGGVTVEVTYPASDKSPLDEADELVVALVRRACPDLTWACADGVSEVRGHL